MNFAKSAEDPYKSSELSILKHSIPEFIKSNVDLMKLVKNIENIDEKNCYLSKNINIWIMVLRWQNLIYVML